MKIDQIKNKTLDCSFCGNAEEDVDFLVEGDKAYICDICVARASDIVKENFHKNQHNYVIFYAHMYCTYLIS